MKFASFFAAVFLAAPACAQQFDPQLISGCAACHGADGISRFGEVPNLADQNQPHLLNQLRVFHTGKRPRKEMGYMSRT
jgi:cytochrome c553